jgi:nicotinamidase-related amidase
MERHPTLLDRNSSVLLVVDMQEPFLNVIHARDALLNNVLQLCKAAAILDVPILMTTQYATRMGPVVPPVLHAIDGASARVRGLAHPVIDKMSFSCAGSELFDRALESQGRKQVVLCGVETHICVSQTAHDLRYNGYQVHVCADGVSARSLEKHKLGMERIRDSGILPAATEAVIYEWLREAGTPQFKEILNLVK